MRSYVPFWLVRSRWLKILVQVLVFILLARFSFYIAIAASHIFYYLLYPVRIERSRFTLDGDIYSYKIGDRMKIRGRRLHGISVALNVGTPHMYIDVRKNDRIIDFRQSFKDISPIKLEGSFGDYATIYASDKDMAANLTLLNPATMEAIQSIGDLYEIELYANCLIVTIPDYFMGSTKQRAQLEQATQTVLRAIHPVLSRWRRMGEQQFESMEIYPQDRMLKIFGKTIMSVRLLLGLMASMACIGIWWLTTIYIGSLMQKSGPQDQHIYAGFWYIASAIFAAIILIIMVIALNQKKIKIQ